MTWNKVSYFSYVFSINIIRGKYSFLYISNIIPPMTIIRDPISHLYNR